MLHQGRGHEFVIINTNTSSQISVVMQKHHSNFWHFHTKYPTFRFSRLRTFLSITIITCFMGSPASSGASFSDFVDAEGIVSTATTRHKDRFTCSVFVKYGPGYNDPHRKRVRSFDDNLSVLPCVLCFWLVYYLSNICEWPKIQDIEIKACQEC